MITPLKKTLDRVVDYLNRSSNSDTLTDEQIRGALKILEHFFQKVGKMKLVSIPSKFGDGRYSFYATVVKSSEDNDYVFPISLFRKKGKWEGKMSHEIYVSKTPKDRQVFISENGWKVGKSTLNIGGMDYEVVEFVPVSQEREPLTAPYFIRYRTSTRNYIATPIEWITEGEFKDGAGLDSFI